MHDISNCVGVLKYDFECYWFEVSVKENEQPMSELVLLPTFHLGIVPI